MQTGENDESLRKVIDLTRFISVAMLTLHFYYYCYTAFEQWNFTLSFTDPLLNNIRKTGRPGK